MDDEKSISAEELEAIFDEGGDVFVYGDQELADRPGLRQRRVGVDMPLEMIERLDTRANACGVTRQALITTWLAERLDLEDRLDRLARIVPKAKPSAKAPKAAGKKKPQKEKKPADEKDGQAEG